MKDRYPRHWCQRCYGPFKGYRKCASINRARSERAWRRREEA